MCKGSISDFNNRKLLLTAKLLEQGYRYHKFIEHFLNSTTDTQSRSLNIILIGKKTLLYNRACRSCRAHHWSVICGHVFEPQHVISNNVAFGQIETQTSLYCLILSLETPNDVQSVA